MTQDAAFGGMQWVQGQNLGEILRGSGTERTSGGRSRPRKTERVVRARIESLEVHQKGYMVFCFTLRSNKVHHA